MHLQSVLNGVPIGKPIWNVSCYILNENMEPCPIGVAGELHLGGIQLARGLPQHGRKNGQNVRSWEGEERKRLYKTGDLVKWQEDGNIGYLGRIDFQVKLRGLRVELGEIENQINACPDVLGCVVLVIKDTLVAYVRPSNVDVNAVKSTISDTLTSYMVPEVFVPMDEFPLSSNGKVDRQQLPSPDIASQKDASEYNPPTPTAETAVCEIFEQVLGMQAGTVGIDNGFFEIGGQSLTAIKAAKRINDYIKKFFSGVGKDLRVSDLYKHLTPKAILEYAIPTAVKQKFGDNREGKVAHQGTCRFSVVSTAKDDVRPISTKCSEHVR